MHVVIVESPAKCKTIGKYLGSDYTVLASFGHVRDLPSKNGSVRPEEDFAMDYEVSSDSQRHIKSIADAVKNADSLILATDPDREGEAISWHVYEVLKQKKLLSGKKIERVSFNSITKKAVQDAIAHPRELDMDLVNAQQARRALDYLVGFTLSPVLWRKLPGSKSAGRVQSVALRLICEREAEIESFKSQEYWDIQGEFLSERKEAFTARLTHLQGKKLDKFALPKEAAAHEVVKVLKTRDYAITDVEKKQAKRHPYPPFITSTLQQEAARKLGFSAKRTMQVAQKLYEGVTIGGETTGLITYMRTDGVTVAGEAIAASRALIEKEYGKAYLPEKPRVYSSKAKNAQEAHEAIRPTDPKRLPKHIASYVSEDELKLYDLIWKRLITSQMESAVLDQVVVTVESTDGYAGLRANGSVIAFDGFYKIYREGLDDESDDEEGKILPPLNKGEKADLTKPLADQHFTQPPPRFTEASLVKEMEKLGIGRPSTYASILSVLQDRGYVVLEKKRFVPETRGRLVTAFLSGFFTQYVEYDFTANLEDELDHISAGDLDWKEALRKFWGHFKANVDSAMDLEFAQVIEQLERILEPMLFPGDGEAATSHECPSCKEGKLGLKIGKFGPFLGCSHYPECQYTRQLGGGNDEAGSEGGVVNPNEPRVLGIDNVSGMEVTLRKGPYGWYVQLGEALEGEKPKRQSLPKGATPESMTLEAAVDLLALPRDVGIHPETGKKVVANIGRYGPYIQHDGKFISLKGDDDVLTIGINRAVDLIAQAATKKGGTEPVRVIGKHPETGEEIGVYEGRYGPYVKHQKLNASLSKNQAIDTITLDEAVALLTAQAAKKKSPVRRKRK